jgi:hypothetical protein
MGKGPKKSDYQPSEADKTSASIALQRYNTFKTKYQPLLVKMRDKAESDGLIKVARARAGADTIQALHADVPQLRAATTVDETTADTGGALTSQLQKATAAGTAAKNDMAAGVVSAANQQGATAQSGLQAIARQNTSDALDRAANKQARKEATMQAIGQLGSAFIGSGGRNLASGGTFFTPNASDVAGGDFVRPEGLRGRLKIGMGRLG